MVALRCAHGTLALCMFFGCPSFGPLVCWASCPRSPLPSARSRPVSGSCALMKVRHPVQAKAETVVRQTLVQTRSEAKEMRTHCIKYTSASNPEPEPAATSKNGWPGPLLLRARHQGGPGLSGEAGPARSASSPGTTLGRWIFVGHQYAVYSTQ